MHSFVTLICPEHGTPLVLSAADKYDCSSGCAFPIICGIPRFVTHESYAASFGLQWNTFRRTQLDSYTSTTISKDRLTRIAGGSLAALEGKNVLEAGCGAGRFTEVLLSVGARVFAADISSAVEANYANCGDSPAYFVCQADVARLPVPRGQFDAVVCIGVIQHTPDPEKTMDGLCAQVKPGGTLLIDHYPPNYAVTPTRRLLRAFLLRRTSTFSMRFCRVLVASMWPLHRLAWKLFGAAASRPLRKVRSLLVRISPVVDYHDAYPQLGAELLKVWALLDTHDTLTDMYKHLRSDQQIEQHLRSRGMHNIVIVLAGNGIEVRATRPALPPRSA